MFVYILQGKKGKTGKTEKKLRNYSDQNTKRQKTKTWDERNIRFLIKMNEKFGNHQIPVKLNWQFFSNSITGNLHKV